MFLNLFYHRNDDSDDDEEETEEQKVLGIKQELRNEYESRGSKKRKAVEAPDAIVPPSPKKQKVYLEQLVKQYLVEIIFMCLVYVYVCVACLMSISINITILYVYFVLFNLCRI